MSLRITAAMDYAIRGTIYLACLDTDQPALRDDIARNCDVPPAFMAKILRLLSATGLLKSIRGARGGFHLGRPAAEITLLDIVVAIEGPLAVAPCVSRSCQCFFDQCPADAIWQDVQSSIERTLSARTLEDLVSDSRRKNRKSAPSESFLLV